MLTRSSLFLFVLLLASCDVFIPSTHLVTPVDTSPPTQGVTVVPDAIANIPAEDNPPQATVIADASIPELPERDGDAQPQTESDALYVVQDGTPLGLPSPSHPDCNWMGVGGQAFGLDGQPDLDVVVQLGGQFNDIERSMVTMAGWAPQWGPGGFELELFDRPMASQGTLWVQLYNTNWQPLSERVYFDTYAECERSFIMINFSQQKIAARGQSIYLPLVLH